MLRKRQTKREREFERGKMTGGTRKVIQLGINCLAITLPAEFVRANNVEAGDDLPYVAFRTLRLIPLSDEKDQVSGDDPDG